MANEPASAPVRERVHISRIRDRHQRCSENLHEADGDVEAEESEEEDLDGRRVGWELDVVVGSDWHPLLSIQVSSSFRERSAKIMLTPKDPYTIPPKLKTSAAKLTPVSSSDFCALMSNPALAPSPQSMNMMMVITIHAYRS